MKKMKFLTMVLAIGVAAILWGSCKKDSSPSPLKVVSVKTDLGVALDGSALVSGVPTSASVIVTFDKDINATTADKSSIALTAGGLDVPSTVSVNGPAVTLKPNAILPTGTTIDVVVMVGLKATDGGPAAPSDLTFMTFGRADVVPPQALSQLSYFPFTGSVKDAIGTHNPTTADVRNLTFASDRFGFASLAADFNGTTTMVEIPDADQYLANSDFTISVWIKANSTKSGQFVFGLGGWMGFEFEIAADWSSVSFNSQYGEPGGLSDEQDNFFPGTGETKDNTGYQGWTFMKDVQPHGGGVGTTYFKDKWCHVVCTYQASTKLATMYLNGDKVKQFDFNLWPVSDSRRNVTGVKFAGNPTGGGNKLALGFIQGSQNRILTDGWADPANIYSNHFQGQMDDLRLFKIALTATEVTTLYTAEKP